MADREYIIDILLKARNDTARAFAEVTGELESYKRLLKEQSASSKDATANQKVFADEISRGDTTLKRYKASLADVGLEYDKSEEKAHKVLVAQRDLEQAQNRLTKTQREGKSGTAELSLATENLLQKQRDLSRALVEYDGRSRQAAQAEASRKQTLAELNARAKTIAADEARARTQRAQSDKELAGLADWINRQTERSKADSIRRLNQMDREESQSRSARLRQEKADVTTAARDNERFLRQRSQQAEQASRDEVRAYKMVEDAAKRTESARRVGREVDPVTRNIAQTRVGADFYGRGGPGGGGGGGGRGTLTAPGGDGGWSGFTGAIEQAQKAMSDMDTTTSGFDQHMKSSFGFSAVTLIQPLVSAIVGLVSVFASLYSAVISAATAIGVSFASAVAQGVPVMGLLAAAGQRLGSIMSYVQAQLQQSQSRFIAQFETAQQNAMGINQVAIAQHNYSDALFNSSVAVRQVTVAEHNLSDAQFAQRQSVFQVGVAQLGLTVARRDATRQLQQLIFQETSARLAAEASSLAITHSQKALREAIATGGDVQQAQLDLAQAHANHAQSVAQAHNAIADAATGSVARQQIQETVVEAGRGVTQAQRAVVDANFALQSAAQGVVQARRAAIDAQYQVAAARAAIIQAQQAAVGYNVAVAAQLAWLRSQMTATERVLADKLLGLVKMFQGARGYLRPVTDAILGAFIPLVSQIQKTLLDPRIFAALLTLGRRIGSAIRSVTDTVFSPQSIDNFLAIMHAAANNIMPIARIVGDLFKAAQSIIVQTLPIVHQFLLFIGGIVHQFSQWATSTQGRNWIAAWFDEAFRSLRAFITLGVAVIRLIAAVVGAGGGARSGINVLQELTRWVNQATDSINRHGRVFVDLQRLWSMAIPTLRVLGTIVRAVAEGFLRLGSSAQGRQGLQGLAVLVANVLVPAFVKFSENMGAITVRLGKFLEKHPDLQHFLVDFIAFAATVAVGSRALGLLFGPFAAILSVAVKLRGVFAFLKGLDILKIFGGAGESPIGAPFAEALGPIAAVVGAFVLLVKWTGTFKDLWNAIKAPFIQFWQQVRQPINDFVHQLEYMLKPIGGLKGALNDLRVWVAGTFRTTFRLLGDLFGGIGKIIGAELGAVIRIISGVFRLIGDIVRGNWGKVFGDFKNIGKAVVQGIWNGLKDLGELIVNVFKDLWGAVLSFFGISSPSKKAHSLGRDIVSGLISAVSSLPGDFLSLGERIVRALIKGIGNLAGDAGKAFLSLIPAPLRDIAGGALNAGKKALGAVGNFFGGLFAEGGPVPGGYGGGDRVLAGVEPGEHIITKEEVRAAGGHESIFALRRSLGGGGQSRTGGYATGGVVSSGSNITFMQLGQQNTSAQTQGVTGLFGSTLANIRLFAQRFTQDWQDLWNNIKKETQNAIQGVQSSMGDWFSWTQSHYRDFLGNMNSDTKNNLKTFTNNFKDTYKLFATDTFNAFWYVNHEANKSLQSFGAKPSKITLDQQPKFAEGGWVGNIGERGKDAVHALLGRGEAVLNWAHQKVVDPALRSYYGFGMDKLFDRVRGTHAGDEADGRGYAKGGGVSGYSLPLPRGEMLPGSWSIDMGVDIPAPANTPEYAIGNGTIIGEGIQGFGPNAPILRLADGPLAGRNVYYGHAGPDRVHTGQQVKAGQQISEVGAGIVGISTGPHIEIGFGPPFSTGGPMASFLRELMSGAGITGINVPGGAAAPGTVAATWNTIKERVVHGTGVLADTLRAAIHKVTDAANKYGQSKAAAASPAPSSATGSTGSPFPQSGGYTNAKKWTEEAMKIAGVSGALWERMLLRQEYRESGYNPNSINLTDSNAAAGHPSKGILQNIDSTFRQYALPGYNKNIYDPVSNIISSIRYMIAAYGHGNANTAAEVMWNRGGGGYARGGFVDKTIARAVDWMESIRKHSTGGTAGMPSGSGEAEMSITAHVGEWVLNRVQQRKLSRLLGVGASKLQEYLGLTGGKTSFKDGGIVSAARGIAPTGHIREQSSSHPDPNLTIIPSTAAFDPTTGLVTDPGYEQNLSEYLSAVDVVNHAQRTIGKMIARLRKNGKDISDGLKNYLKNLDQLTGDGGILTLAAQALDDYISQQNTVVSLAANGIRVFGQTFHNSRPQSALDAAQQDLKNTQQVGDDLRKLQRQELAAYQGVQAIINRFGKVTQANRAQYARLIGQRRALITQMADTDSKIAQNLQDQIDKRQTQFQAQLDQTLRGSTTLNAGQIGGVTIGALGGAGRIQAGMNNLQKVLGSVGPNIASGLAQMAQTIAQTLGNTDQLQTADQAVLSTARRTQAALQTAYNQAAQRAQGDPRWRKVADDLLGQLESATTAVVQAQAQALTDAITAVDTRIQVRTAALDVRNRLAQVITGFGDQFTGISQQIGVSRERSQFLQSQIGQYQSLLGQARSQGNVQAQNDLTQKIGDLTAQVAEANLQTQQLITSYRQVAVTMLSARTQASSGFFGAANTIAQTLGQISGSLNLPALISYAQAQGQSLINEGRSAVQNVLDTINDPSGPFSTNQGQAAQFLHALTAAFNQGPQTFANVLSQLAPSMSNFEAQLPPEQQQLFQSLVQSLVDNTTAQVSNTQQLQQLNATTGQQQFQSSAWSLFRQAIFSGLGTLLPQYAMQVPAMDSGGLITRSGLLYGHTDETIIPANVSRGVGAGNTYNQEYHTHITSPTEVADPNYLGNAIAWRINHGPNSR